MHDLTREEILNAPDGDPEENRQADIKAFEQMTPGLIRMREFILGRYKIYFAFIDAELGKVWKRTPEEKTMTRLLILENYIFTYKIYKKAPTVLSKEEQNRLIIFIDAYINSGKLLTKDFYFMLQGKGTNTLTKTKTSFIPDQQIGIFGNARIKVDDTFTLTIKDYRELKNGISTTAYMLLDCFVIQFTETGTKDCSIRLPLKKYMEMRGLKDEKTARKQILADIEALRKIEYEASEKIRGRWVRSGSVSLYGGTGFIKNSIICFNFNVDFYNQLLNYKVMEYSKETLKINSNQHPHAYYFSRYIDENYRLNEGKDRVHVISISTLIEKAQELPSYETVKLTNRNYKGRIIEPVIRDLDSLDQLYYDLLDKEGNIIDDPKELNYEEFIACKIKIDYADYPIHKKRIANKDKYSKKPRRKSEEKA
ncbi:MAG: hypothetical protein P9M03_05520 [Candidatus Theseobacter exili]|nr:hypothetical protein [Candidatus Theseobacter exili]